MKTQKVFLFLLALLLAFGGLSTQWTPAHAAKVIKKKTVTKKLVYQKSATLSLGRSGVYFSSSNYTATAELTRLNRGGALSDRSLAFQGRPIEIRIYDSQDHEISQVYGLIYVFFNLNKRQRSAWKAGDLSIYHYDQRANEWTACTNVVYITTKNKPNGRLACIIQDFGIYSLATTP